MGMTFQGKKLCAGFGVVSVVCFCVLLVGERSATAMPRGVVGGTMVGGAAGSSSSSSSPVFAPWLSTSEFSPAFQHAYVWTFPGAIPENLRNPGGMAVDNSTNPPSLLVSDTLHHRLVRITTKGTVTTIAGNGTPGYSGDNALANSAQLNHPYGVAVGQYGAIIVADTRNHCIREIFTDADGQVKIRTVAGNGTPGHSGDNGPASSAQLNHPYGVAIGPNGAIVIADTANNTIRELFTDPTPDGTTPDGTTKIRTVAGNGTPGHSGDNGPASSAQLNHPHGVAIGPNGAIVIADTWNHCVRIVFNDLSGTWKIARIMGSGEPGYHISTPPDGCCLKYPHGVAVSYDNAIWVADTYNNFIIRVFHRGTAGIVTATRSFGSGDGYRGDRKPATQGDLAFNFPSSIAVTTQGTLVIADTHNDRIRIIGTPTSNDPIAQSFWH